MHFQFCALILFIKIIGSQVYEGAFIFVSFISPPPVSLSVVWCNLFRRVQRYNLPHHHLRTHGDEPGPRGQVQRAGDRHGHRRHHQSGGHSHSGWDLWNGGCLAHRTGWEIVRIFIYSHDILHKKDTSFGHIPNTICCSCPFIPFPPTARHESLIEFLCPPLLEHWRILGLSVGHQRDFLKRRFNKWASLWICKEGGKGESMCCHLLNKT